MRGKFPSWSVVVGLWCCLSCSAAVSQASDPERPRVASLTSEHTEHHSVDEKSPPVDGDLRLSDLVVPKHYELEFTIDPTLPTFSGTARIRLNVSVPTEWLHLHAASLKLLKTEVRQDGKLLEARTVSGSNGGLGIQLSGPVSGPLELFFQYEGGLEETPMSLYRVADGPQHYAFTQFQPLSAREAFPSFDEPQFKTPFSIRIKTPAQLSAFSNAPLVEVRKGQQEWTHQFADTKPIPTYLVALAVGDFEVRTDDDATATPSRVIATSGKGQHAAYALEQTPAMLRYLEQYTGISYPYQKLDQIAVPNFRAGAMENAGLVTYRESILLVDGARASHHHTIRSRAVIAHELAHMWFGNLVTLRWWDDTWLNEASATWMANKVLTHVAPELDSPLYAVESMLGVMDHDAMASAAPVRKPIVSSGDVRNAFDYITYTKGAAVLRMLENWVGAAEFQQGIGAYLKRHAWSNASMSDLVAAVDAASEKPVRKIAESYVNNAGVPTIRLQTQCQDNQLSVEFSQSRYRTLGQRGVSSEPWAIPVCMRLIRGRQTAVVCDVFNQSVEQRTLAVPFCPKHVYPNADAHGYYHFELPDEALLALATGQRQRLSLPERIALPAHAWAMFEAGKLKSDSLLRVLEGLSRERHRLVVSTTIAQLRKLRRVFAEGSPEDAKYSAWVHRLLRGHARRVGLVPRKGETIAEALLRPTLFDAYAELGADANVRSRALAFARRFARAGAQQSEESIRLLLPIAARRGDAGLHQALVSLLQQGPTPTVRDILVQSLGSFQDPALLKASFELLFSGTLRAQDYRTLARGAMATEAGNRSYWRYYLANEARLIKLLGASSSLALPRAAERLCSKQSREEAAAHFSDVGRLGSGAQKAVAQSLEAIDRCVVLRKQHAASVPALL